MGNSLTQYQEVGRGYTPEAAIHSLEAALVLQGFKVCVDPLIPVPADTDGLPGLRFNGQLWNYQELTGVFHGHWGNFSAQIHGTPIWGYGRSAEDAIQACLCLKRELEVGVVETVTVPTPDVQFFMTSTTRLGTGWYRVQIEQVSLKSSSAPQHYRAQLVAG